MTSAYGIAVGGRVGSYEITGELGDGGMGVVYRAVHKLLHRPAAIKVLRPEFATNASALDRFLNEARATTAIRHPGIVEIYDYGHTESGCAYIAMELLEGVPLSARLARYQTLAPADALLIARRIAGPLAVAHEAGIVHRDLKPDNVFLIRDPEGGVLDQVKLLDFGIAKLVSADCRTTIGVILGTPAYMSPEQCRGIPNCDHRADLYALGCILFELVTGAPPFGRDRSMSELIAAHLNAPVPELPHVSGAVGRLIKRLLAKSPADRPCNAAEVVDEIDRCLTLASPRLPVAKPSLRRAIATAASLALALTGIGVWYRSRCEPNPPPVLAGSDLAQGTILPFDASPTNAADYYTNVGAASSRVDATPPITEVLDAPPAVVRPRTVPHHSSTEAPEVLTDLGSAATADVNTTVSP